MENAKGPLAVHNAIIPPSRPSPFAVAGPSESESHVLRLSADALALGRDCASAEGAGKASVADAAPMMAIDMSRLFFTPSPGTQWRARAAPISVSEFHYRSDSGHQRSTSANGYSNAPNARANPTP